MSLTEYKIQFAGELTLNRPLLPQQVAYLDRFLSSWRVICSVEYLQDVPDPLREAVGLPLGPEGAYFVGLNIYKERARQPSVHFSYKLPQGQPNSLCGWRLEDGIKFRYVATDSLYLCFSWLQYLLDHFLTPWGYQLEGEVSWQGDDKADRGKMIVKESVIEHCLEQVVGKVVAWNLRRWVQANVWESEDGPSRQSLCQREYYWDGPLCWIDERTLAVWGYGADDLWLIPAIRLFDVRRGNELGWFAGPEKGTLVFDEYLFSFSEQHGLSAWDVATGEQVGSFPAFRPTHYHRGAKQFLQLDIQDSTALVGTLTQQ